MTITSLRAALARVTSDHRVDLNEMREIVEAVGPDASNGEALLIGDLYDARSGQGPQGTATNPYLTASAVDHLDQTFARLALPFGSPRAAIVDGLRTFFTNSSRGTALAQAPRTSSLIALTLQDDRAGGGEQLTAFFNVVTKKAHLRVDDAAGARSWFGPFDVTQPPTPAPGQTTIWPQPAGLSVERLGHIGNSARDVIDHHSAFFGVPSLPAGASLFDLGVRAVRQNMEFRVFLVDDGRPPEQLDTYFIGRTGGGPGPGTFAGPLTLTATPPAVDPLTDGVLTNPGRARNLFYDLNYSDNLNYNATPGAPPSSIALARGSRFMRDATAYYVIPRKADGTLDDPDKATSVYFRHDASNRWSGPHTLP